MCSQKLQMSCPVLMIGLFLAGIGQSSRASCQEAPPENVNLCEISSHHKQLDKKRIRVRARVETAVIEGGTWLESDSCSQSVELDVPAEIRLHPEAHPDYKTLDDAILKNGNIGTAGKRIIGTFTGVLAVRSKRPKLTLSFERVEDLSVQLDAKPSSSALVHESGHVYPPKPQ
jgi:hypothetical protein